MKRIVAPIVFAASMLLASPAYAQATVGNRLNEILKDITGPFVFLISLVCLVGGVALLIKGFLKLKESSGNQAQAGTAIAIIAAAALLIALPETAGTGMMTLTGTGNMAGIVTSSDISAAKIGIGDESPGSFSSKTADVGAVTDCYSAAEPVPCMAGNIARNVVPIGIVAVFIIVFVSGLWGLGSALFETTKIEGGRSLPDGWWGRVIFNIVLLNASVIFQIASQTLLGNAGTVRGSGLEPNSTLLKYDIGVSGATFQQYETLIGHVFTILALFGAIAFVRGIMVCKSAGDGKQGGSYSHGIVFIVAGVLLANSKYSTCLVLGTMLGNSGTFGFC